MKIICNSCGAQHWLSDMQVSQGGCNIKCPICSAKTYVDGSMIDPASLEPKWYYAVNEESVGPLSTQELEFSFQNGQIALESYVWRDGLSDWMALEAVSELDYLKSPVQAESVSDDAATHVAAGFGSAGGYDDLSNSPGEETAAIDLEEFKKTAGEGGSNYSPFGGSDGGIMGMDDNTADSSAFGSDLGSMPSANDLVGQRSENSVLFSLSSLQAVSAPAAPSPGAAPASNAGLIDVKALASSSPAPRRRANQPIDTFGGSSVPMGTVLPLGTKKDNTPLIIGLIVAGVVIVALFVTTIIVLSSGNGDQNNVQQAQLDESKLAANDLGVAPSGPTEEEKAEAEKKAAEEKAAAEKEAAEKAEAEKKAAEEKEAAEKAEAEKKAEEEKAAAEKAEADKKKTDTKKTDTKTATAKDTKKTTDTTKKTETKTETKTDTKTADKKTETKPAGGGNELSRDEILSTIRGSFAQVRTCARTSPTSGQMKVSFVIKGDGRVGNARVMSPEFANSATGTCVLKVVNGLKFRATGKDTPINNYPFQIQK